MPDTINNQNLRPIIVYWNFLEWHESVGAPVSARKIRWINFIISFGWWILTRSLLPSFVRGMKAKALDSFQLSNYVCIYARLIEIQYFPSHQAVKREIHAAWAPQELYKLSEGKDQTLVMQKVISFFRIFNLTHERVQCSSLLKSLFCRSISVASRKRRIKHEVMCRACDKKKHVIFPLCAFLFLAGKCSVQRKTDPNDRCLHIEFAQINKRFNIVSDAHT